MQTKKETSRRAASARIMWARAAIVFGCGAMLLSLRPKLPIHLGPPTESPHSVLRLVGNNPDRMLGDLDYGSSAEATFVVQNVSGREVQVSRAWTSCGCTIASLDKRVLMPGESTSVVCKADTTDYGPKGSRVFLNYLGTSHAFEVGTIEFRVLSGWTTTNPKRLLIDLSDGATPMPIILRADSDVDLASISIEEQIAGIDFEQVLHGNYLHLRPRVHNDLIPRGRFKGRVVVRSDSRNNSEYEVILDIDCREPEFEFSPGTLRAGFVREGEAKRLPFRASLAGAPLSAKSVRTAARGVDLTLIAGHVGQDQALEVTCNDAFTRATNIYVTVEFGSRSVSVPLSIAMTGEGRE